MKRETIICPECDSGNIEMNSGQGYGCVTSYGCHCNECGCVFNKIETTKVSYEVEKHGTKC